MRRIKVVENEPGTYHVISRVVAGERLLETKDREVFRTQMWRMAEFCGVEVLTYCILSNHFHLLVRVPAQCDVSDQELVRRYAVLYGEGDAKVLEKNLQSPGLRGGLRAGLLKRMHDLSFFVKELKLRFTLYFNKNHNRFGTLWAEKFKSLLVESDPRALLMVAAYIDLNPVRAGLCRDPKDYRFCGYAEAVAGNLAARDGLMEIAPGRNWREVASQYRVVLFGAGVVSDRSKEGGIDSEKCRKVLEAGGRLPMWEFLRCRIRYFSDGVALGTAEFIESVRKENSGFEAQKRPGKAPAVPVEEDSDLCFARRRRAMRDISPEPM